MGSSLSVCSYTLYRGGASFRFPLASSVKSHSLVRLPSLLIRAEFLYEPRAVGVAATSRGNSSSTTRTGPTARRDAVRKHNRKKLSAKRESASRVQCRPPWRSPVLRVLGRGARGRSEGRRTPRAVASRAHFVTNGIQCVVYSRTRIDDSTLRLTFDASSGSVAAPPRLAPTFGKTGMLGPWPHSAAPPVGIV